MTNNSTVASGLAVAASVLVLAGCTAVSPLAADLRAAVDASTGSLVIGTLDSVDGTDFLVVCPYETDESITARLGFEWADAPDYAQRDDRQTVAIIRDGGVVASAELERSVVDFCATGDWPVLDVDTELALDRTVDPARVFPPGAH